MAVRIGDGKDQSRTMESISAFLDHPRSGDFEVNHKAKVGMPLPTGGAHSSRHVSALIYYHSYRFCCIELPTKPKYLPESGGKLMSIFMIVFAVLGIAWLLGLTMFHIAGGFIHILLLLAVISLVLHFVRGSRGVA